VSGGVKNQVVADSWGVNEMTRKQRKKEVGNAKVHLINSSAGLLPTYITTTTALRYLFYYYITYTTV
jgi:hypothetical protein